MKQDETRFYEFSHNSFHTRGFTWAMSILPRSEMLHQVCADCGAVVNYPSGAFDVIVEGGTKYPDILGCGAYPFLIVSEAVVVAWQESGISCFHTYPVGISQVKSSRLHDVVPPLYSRVEIDGRCQIDLKASGARDVKYCPRCHHLVTIPSTIPGFRVVSGSWDGCALFRDPVLYPRVSFCTDLIVDVAGRYRLTNFRFEPMEGPFDPSSKGIDYLKKRR